MNKDIYDKIYKYYSLDLEDEDKALCYYIGAQLSTLTNQDWKDFKEELKKK